MSVILVEYGCDCLQGLYKDADRRRHHGPADIDWQQSLQPTVEVKTWFVHKYAWALTLSGFFHCLCVILCSSQHENFFQNVSGYLFIWNIYIWSIWFIRVLLVCSFFSSFYFLIFYFACFCIQFVYGTSDLVGNNIRCSGAVSQAVFCHFKLF